MLINDAGHSQRRTLPVSTGAIVAGVAVVAVLIGLQVAAGRTGFQGPLHSLISDLVLTGLALLAGLRWSGTQRGIALRATGWGPVAHRGQRGRRRLAAALSARSGRSLCIQGDDTPVEFKAAAP